VIAGLAEDGFAAIPRDGIWNIAMWTLANAASRLDDRDLAAQVYDQLLPLADNSVALGASMYLGPVRTSLGMLAAVLGRTEDAAAHFGAAIERLRELGARPFLAYALAAYALASQRTGDADRIGVATAMASEAAAMAAELGMSGVLADLSTAGLVSSPEDPQKNR
jgi:tetratricopeptide (TPR) repeat protein